METKSTLLELIGMVYQTLSTSEVHTILILSHVAPKKFTENDPPFVDNNIGLSQLSFTGLSPNKNLNDPLTG